jgi:hypothetical protein
LPFGEEVKVCHHGCVIVRINGRGSFARGRNIDRTPAAAGAIGLDEIGDVTLALGRRLYVRDGAPRICKWFFNIFVEMKTERFSTECHEYDTRGYIYRF